MCSVFAVVMNRMVVARRRLEREKDRLRHGPARQHKANVRRGVPPDRSNQRRAAAGAAGQLDVVRRRRAETARRGADDIFTGAATTAARATGNVERP